MYYFLTFIAVLLLALQFILNKLYQTKIGSSLLDSLEYSVIISIATSVIFIAASGFRFEFTPYSFLLAFLKSVMVTINTIIGLKVLKQGEVAVYTLFLMLGGMIVPYVYGIVFINEEITVLRLIGLLIMISAIVLTIEKRNDTNLKKISRQTILFYVIIFISNGFVSVFSKMHQIADQSKTVSTEGFVVLGCIVPLVFNFILMMIYRQKRPNKVRADKKRILVAGLIGVLCAVVSGVSYYFQLIGASNLPATVLYPMITGGSIALTAVAAAIAFKEKPKKMQLCGLTLAFLATFMFL